MGKIKIEKNKNSTVHTMYLNQHLSQKDQHSNHAAFELQQALRPYFQQREQMKLTRYSLHNYRQSSNCIRKNQDLNLPRVEANQTQHMQPMVSQTGLVIPATRAASSRQPRKQYF